MQKSFPIFLFLLLAVQTKAQVWKDVVFSTEMEQKYEEDSSASEAFSLMYYAIYNSDYPTAEKWAKNAGDSHGLSTQQDSLLQTMNVFSAKDSLLKYTRSHEFVIANDPLQNPSQRIFLTKLLPELWAQGYRYLGLKNLAVDTLKGKQVLTDSMGVFLRDYYFRKLVTTALNLGFTCFSLSSNATDYASISKDCYDKFCAFQQLHTDGKYLLLVDDYQLLQQTGGQFTSLTEELCRVDAVQALTLKSEFWKSDSADTSLFFQKINAPSYLVQQDSIPFGGFQETTRADFQLFYPYFAGVPEDENFNFTLPSSRIFEFPCLIYVYNNADLDSTLRFNYNKVQHVDMNTPILPMKVMEITNKHEPIRFHLSKGQYTLLFLYVERDLTPTLNVIITK